MSKTCDACGFPVDDPRHSRSPDQLKRYHASMVAWFSHWPESAHHQFASVTEMRKYLQMAAGWREVGASIPISGMRKEQAMLLAEAAIRAAGSYALPAINGDVLVIFRPKSVALHKMPSRDFCKLFDDVREVFRRETGLDPDQVAAEAERAA